MKNISEHHRQWLIIRHAKSSWADPNCHDRDRPLNKRGKRDAKWIGRQLEQRQWHPELIINSDATRVRETFKILSAKSEQTNNIRWRRSFYLCEATHMMNVIRQLPDNLQSVMTIGHNPTCEALIEHLCGHDVHVTTANIIRLVCVAPSWKQAIKSQWVCVDVLRPRDPRT